MEHKQSDSGLTLYRVRWKDSTEVCKRICKCCTFLSSLCHTCCLCCHLSMKLHPRTCALISVSVTYRLRTRGNREPLSLTQWMECRPSPKSSEHTWRHPVKNPQDRHISGLLVLTNHLMKSLYLRPLHHHHLRRWLCLMG